MSNNFPKLHNAGWPGVVGKGPDAEEPFFELDTMLDFTAKAEVNGTKFDGVDLFLAAPHVDIESTRDDLEKVAEKCRSRGLEIGSVVAPVWGGPAMGSDEDRKTFLDMVKKGCGIAKNLKEIGVRTTGVVRIDSASGVADWAKDPEGNTRKIADTFIEACKIADDHGEKLAAEGEICWGGMHSLKEMLKLLELVDRPKTLGFQADLAHTLLYLLGYNAPEGEGLLPADFDWKDQAKFDKAYAEMTAALRPWTIDFHVAQNDATVKGSGSHDKTGRHCTAKDPNGKLDISKAAGHWLRDEKGEVTKVCRHICWDGCMFPNATMQDPQTWNDILQAMIDVREKHGWSE